MPSMDNTREALKKAREYAGKLPPHVRTQGAALILQKLINAIDDAANAEEAKPAPDDRETEAWLIEWHDTHGHRKAVFGHNAIGDYRAMYEGATSTELVRRDATLPAQVDAQIDRDAPTEGQEVSIDVSTCDEGAGNRIFARLTGDRGSDGTWLAEEISRNFKDLGDDALINEGGMQPEPEQPAPYGFDDFFREAKEKGITLQDFVPKLKARLAEIEGAQPVSVDMSTPSTCDGNVSINRGNMDISQPVSGAVDERKALRDLAHIGGFLASNGAPETLMYSLACVRAALSAVNQVNAQPDWKATAESLQEEVLRLRQIFRDASAGVFGHADGYLAVNVETLQMIYEAMNYMGDALNNMDAVEEEDIEKTSPAFDAIRELIATLPDA